MNATRLPLPLELTKPVLLAGDLDTEFRTGLDLGTYDPKTQLCGSRNGSSSCSNNTQTWTFAGIVVDSVDVQVDDIL